MDMLFRVYSFKFPYSNTKYSKYSFSTISIKILNLFLFNYITKNDTKTKFKNGIGDHFILLKFYKFDSFIRRKFKYLALFSII